MPLPFPGDPDPLPTRPPGIRVTVVGAPRQDPLPVRHAAGYDRFVRLAETFGTDPADLLDLWRFAHFVRAHTEAFRGDPELERSAVVFLGNGLIARHPDLRWWYRAEELVVETTDPPSVWAGDGPEHLPARRFAAVQRIVEALLEADEARFLEFHGVVGRWRSGGDPPSVSSSLPHRNPQGEPVRVSRDPEGGGHG